MKTKFFIFAAILSLAVFAACDDDSDIKNVNKHVPTAAQTRVSQAYPNTRVEWEFERGLLKAEIYTIEGEVDMWFQKDGTWVGTEKDYNPALLSEAIKAYIQTNHPGYYIDDVDIWETPNGIYFEIELDNGKRETVIKLTESGEGVNY